MHRSTPCSDVHSGARSGASLLLLAAVTACSTATPSTSPTTGPAGRDARGPETSESPESAQRPKRPQRPRPAALARRSPSLLANGDFSAGLAHWKLAGEGAVVDDPEQPGNPVLRIQHVEDLFGLSHALTVPDGTQRLRLHFRVMATAASEDAPISLRLRLYDQDGNSGIAMWTITRPGTWIEIEDTITDLPSQPVSVLLENNRGAGALLVDDVTLRAAP